MLTNDENHFYPNVSGAGSQQYHRRSSMRSIHLRMSVVAAAVYVAIFFAGCAKAPVKELADAKAALQAAQAAEADKYLADRYNQAKKALEAAESEINKQNAAFILSRKYSEAARLLNTTMSIATELKAEAAGAKETMKAEVKAALPSAQSEIKELRKEVKRVPKSKGKASIAAMEADLTAADNSLVRAAAEIAAGNYLDAKKQTDEARAKLRKVTEQLSIGGAGGLM